MEWCIGGSSKITYKTEMVLKSDQMGLGLKDSSKMEKNMVKEHLILQMEIYILEVLLKMK